MTSDLFGKPPSPSYALDEDEYLLALHRPCDLSILVSETGDESRAFWLPRSKIEFEYTGRSVQARVGSKKLTAVKVKIPEWLAKERGLI